MSHELLTVRELAELLRINEKKIYRLANQGKLPGTRAAGKWLFPRGLVQEWIESQARETLTSTQKSGKSTVEHQVTLLISDDIAVNTLVKHFNRSQASFVAVTAVVGSGRALAGLALGRADLAGVHLMDPAGKGYNREEVKRVMEGRRILAVHVAGRVQGLITAPGNPMGLASLADLGRKGIRFINRQWGSGTRRLLDQKLKELGLEASRIAGYEREVDSHIEAAVAVLRKEADLALGIGSAAGALGLHFVPILKENYDLVALEEGFYRPAVQAFMEALKSDFFSSLLDALPGYDGQRTGQVTVL